MTSSELRGPAVEGLPLLEDVGRLTLGCFLLEVCARYGDQPALVLDDPLRGGATVRWSYADLGREAHRVARSLLALGLGKGARVATVMANRPEAVAAFFGTALAGAVAVPLSTFSTRAELAHLLAHSEASVVLAQAQMGSHLFARDLAEEVGAPPYRLAGFAHLRHVVVLGEQQHGLTPWEDFLAAGEDVPDELVDAAARATSPADHALVLYSSGTTATPKGVLHVHRSPTLQFWVQAELFGRHRSTRMWSALPLFWTAGLCTAMGATLAAGGCWVMQEGFDAGTALHLLERERVTEPYTLPHQARALAEHPDWERTDLSSLECVFGKSVFARHPSVTGDPGWQMPVGWGMSESCAFLCAHPSTSSRDTMKASLGRLLPGVRLRVVDPETGDVLPLGATGELAVRGPTLMDRYVGSSREECFDGDGWFRTGDLGHVDAQGQVHWEGRRTEMIKSGGANIAPAEVEVQLRAHPAVRLARVLAVPDPVLDQVALLCVELVEGAEPDPEGITEFLKERLSSYKVPKRVLFFGPGEIPLTAAGTKVRDDALRDLVLARTPTGAA